MVTIEHVSEFGDDRPSDFGDALKREMRKKHQQQNRKACVSA